MATLLRWHFARYSTANLLIELNSLKYAFQLDIDDLIMLITSSVFLLPLHPEVRSSEKTAETRGFTFAVNVRPIYEALLSVLKNYVGKSVDTQTALLIGLERAIGLDGGALPRFFAFKYCSREMIILATMPASNLVPSQTCVDACNRFPFASYLGFTTTMW